MIPEIVASSILLLSFAGILFLVGRKIPVLLSFPAKEEGSSPRALMEKFKKQMQNSKRLRQAVSLDLVLQTLLSKTRIVALKTESKTGQILEKLRKKSQEQNGTSKFSDKKYWKQLKRKSDKQV